MSYETKLQELCYQRKEDIRFLRFALVEALEFQRAVEKARPEGYGPPTNTLCWFDLAERALEKTEELTT